VHRDAGDLRDDVVEALHVLHVERRVHVDAGREQLLHVEVALGMARSRRVGVRQLVHQGDARPARQHGVEVHLCQVHVAVLDLPAGHHLQPAEQDLRLAASVGLHVGGHHVHAIAGQLAGRLEHGVGLADPGSIAEKDL
jgi:hypothetical protein